MTTPAAGLMTVVRRPAASVESGSEREPASDQRFTQTPYPSPPALPSAASGATGLAGAGVSAGVGAAAGAGVSSGT